MNKKGMKSMWLLYAVLSALFASLMTIFMKLGLKNIDANLATTIRTSFVVIFCWCLTIYTKNVSEIKTFTKSEWVYLVLASIATFGTWIFYFLALKNGLTAKVLAIDRFSIVITVILSTIFLKEKLTLQLVVGMIILVIGIFMVVYS